MGILDWYGYGYEPAEPAGKWPEPEDHETRGVPLLMLPPDSHPNNSPSPIFLDIFAVSTDLTHTLPPPPSSSVCCGTSHGWLLLAFQDQLTLLNPLTQSHLQLPTLPAADIHKAILTSDPCNGVSPAVVVIFGKDRKLASARIGEDESWKVISAAGGLFHDVIYYNSRLLAVDKFGGVVQVHLLDSSVSPITNSWYRGSGKLYLAGIPYGLCLAIRSVDQTSGLTERFDVYDLNFGNWKWERVEDLSSRMLFLGQNHSFALPTTTETESLKNCIHFTDDSDGGNGQDMGIFMMSDESIMRAPGRPSKSSSLRPTWFLKQNQESKHQEE